MAAIGRMEHRLLDWSGGLLGSEIQDLILGFHPDRHLQLILGIGAGRMMDQDQSVQISGSGSGTVNVLYLGVKPALVGLQVYSRELILIYPVMVRIQEEGKTAQEMTAGDGTTEMNDAMTGRGWNMMIVVEMVEREAEVEVLLEIASGTEFVNAIHSAGNVTRTADERVIWRPTTLACEIALDNYYQNGALRELALALLARRHKRTTLNMTSS